MRREGCYQVTYEEDGYDVSFCVPEVIDGAPIEPPVVLTNGNDAHLRIHHWVQDGREFRAVARPGHACQGVTPGEAPPADDNWQLDVRVHVRQVEPRFQAGVTWQGTTRTCAPGGGEFTIDAPVQDRPDGSP